MEPVNAVCDMKVVKVSGTHLEMGKQLRAQTLELMQKEFMSFTDTMKIELNLDESFVTSLLDNISAEATKKISKTLANHAPNQLQLIEGMAEGKQSSPENIGSKHFFLALYLDMFLSDWHIQYKIVKEGGCSGIIITPEASQTGKMLLGRNYDLTYSLGMTQVLKVSSPSNGFKNMAVSQATWAGSHCGMNEKGLVIYYNLNHPYRDFDRTHRGIPTGIIVQEALETCASADEAIEFIKNTKRSSGANLTVGDSKNAYVIEVSRKKYGVRTPENGVLAETNHYIHPDMLSENIPEFPVLRYSFKPLEDELITTHKRYETEVRFLNTARAKGKLTMDDLKAILRSHEPNKKHSPCNHGPVGGTLASMITKPVDREMYIAIGQPCLTTYEKYTL
ncbi:MAG: linear amide C-N hydrolase [Candidatus Helarchaeota archaeon]|nr:linear amide C-N hydrolase [Candidatus Helarchaeota archaeon]